MYNPQLETFIRVADAGSFNKAAEQAYITPTAVLKQINLLCTGTGATMWTGSAMIFGYAISYGLLHSPEPLATVRKIFRCNPVITSKYKLMNKTRLLYRSRFFYTEKAGELETVYACRWEGQRIGLFPK